MKRKSLTNQIGVMIVVITTLLLSGFGYYRYMADRRGLMLQLNGKNIRIANRLSTNLSLPLYNLDNGVLINTIKAEMEDQEIVSILLYENKNDEPVFKYTRLDDGTITSSGKEFIKGNYLSVKSDIVYDQKKFGVIHVFMTKKYIMGKLRKNLITDIFQIVVLDILLILFVMIMLRIKIIRPLLNLTNVSSAIASGDLKQNINTVANDEIGILADSLTRMRNSIREKIAELEKEIIERISAQAEQQRLIMIIEATTDMVSSSLPDKTITYMNRAGRKMIGWSDTEDGGLKSIPDMHPQWALNRIRDEGIPTAIAHDVWEGETALIAPDGREFPVSQVIMAHKTPENELEYLSTIIRDISEHKRAEEELARYRDQLEHLVKERTKELENAQKELIKNERMAVLGRLIATVSHELRNPLGVIRSSIYYLLKKIKTKDQKPIKHINRINEQIDQCNSIIQDLMEYSRGSRSVVFPKDLNSFLNEVTDSIIPDEQADISLDSKFSLDLPLALFDKAKMKIVSKNIFKNAIRAIREKQKNTVKKGENYKPIIELKTSKSENGIKVEIEDNGIGMDTETQKQAFDPLFTTITQGSTGLGLSIVKKIIEEHEGSISIQSNPDQGTNVCFEIPVQSSTATPKAGPTTNTADHSDNKPTSVL